MRIAQLASRNGDEKSVTFVFENEGHTLGNALRWIVSSYPNVLFCGYTVPHPAEAKMNFRIQTSQGRAVDLLRKGLEDLAKVCDQTLEVFDDEMLAYKTDHNLACS